MDYYSILGVSKTASQTDLKSAYRKLAMKHHPDRGGDAHTLQKINEAYDTLKDPQKRAMYDHSQTRVDSSMFSHGYSPDFEDLFRRQQVPRNRDITIAARLELADVFFGKSILATYRLGSGKTETVNLDIPRGAHHGNTMRYKGLGDDRFPGPRGNLYVKIEVKEHPQWARDRDDLYHEVKVNALDMIIGGSVDITTLDDRTINLKIPSGTRENTKFSINGYGTPNVNTGTRGRLFIIVAPKITKITDKNILRKLTKLRNSLT